MVRLMEKNFCNGDTNGDHLQLALALSRSMQDLENSSPKEEEDDLSAVYHPPRGNAILEQFGFNSGQKLAAENKIATSDAFKKRKRSRYQYVTPVLFLRTKEDRDKIIATKISLILSQKNKSVVDGSRQQAISLSSSYLQSLHKSGVYELNQLTHEELQGKEVFYLNNLKVPRSTCAGGYLLKDWNDIFGREVTPPREVAPSSHTQLESNKENEPPREETTPPPSLKKDLDPAYHQSQSNKEKLSFSDEAKVTKSLKSCMSPDLFESDDDLVVNDLNRSINEQLELSQRLINNFKSHSIFLNKSTSSEAEDDGKEKQRETRSNFDSSENDVEKCLEYESRSGICHFESFHESQDYGTVKGDAADFEKIPSTLNAQGGGCSKEIMQKAVGKLHDFYDLTASSDDENESLFHTRSKSRSFQSTSLSENDHFVESIFQSSRLERASVANCELEVSSTSKESPITFNTSRYSNNGNKSDSETNLTQETISDEEHFKKLDDLSLNTSKPTNSFSLDANNFRHNYTCVSESDENLSGQQSEEEEFQNKLIINCASKSSLQKSLVGRCNSSEANELSQENLYNKKAHGFSSDAKRYKHNYTFVSESDANLSDEECQNEIIPPADWGSKNSLQNSSAGGNSIEKHNSFSSTSDGGNFSQESFGDEEVNYSSMYTKSIINLEDSNSEEEFCETTTVNKPRTSKSNVSATEVSDCEDYRDTNVATPENKHDDKLIIKTKGITPMPNYMEMDTPGIAKELQKFGVKNLKRRRGVELLHYIYNSTHPLVPGRQLGNIDDASGNPVKRRKKDDVRKKLESKYNEEKVELVGDLLQENENDLIFEKKQSAKVASCRVPLHIAWFNLVASHPGIKESILLYEPLQLEVLYLLLKEQGYKYTIQDLLTFLDRKCITIRTNQNQRKTAAQNQIKVNKATSQLIL